MISDLNFTFGHCPIYTCGEAATSPIEPIEPIEPAEPLSGAIKWRYAPKAKPDPDNFCAVFVYEEISMVPEDIKKQAEKLKKELRHHSYLYYVLDRPEISDFDFDHMYRQLVDL